MRNITGWELQTFNYLALVCHGTGSLSSYEENAYYSAALFMLGLCLALISCMPP